MQSKQPLTHTTRPLLLITLIALVLLASTETGWTAEPARSQPASVASAPAADVTQGPDLFVAGQEGYRSFRIPSLITTRKGTLLAFCEGRKDSASDTGNIDTVLRRSTDGGRTWGPLQLVAGDGPNTVGNPCPVVDRTTGTIWLLLTQNVGSDREDAIKAAVAANTRRVWVSRSDDDGLTWSKPKDITADAKRPEWTWYATGPGCGIQLTSGRLVIPCDFSLKGREKLYGSHVIYSDDHGATWHIGGVAGKDVNECQVVERADGSLMLNMRSYRGQRQRNCRAVSVSRDGGATWSPLTWDETLIDPICQASFIRCPAGPKTPRDCLVFANPASTKRERMTVRVSYDGGESWPVATLLYAGPSAYSALASLPDGRVACLYECGEKNSYERLRLAWVKVP
jgi:sialidase-1